jgi:thiopurine S-methyltransferase
MADDRWLAVWREDRIGFHEGVTNALLAAHADQLAGRSRVLVPLCGKTVDLTFLAQRGHAVVGIELVELAAQAFFREHELVPEISPFGPFTRYASGSIQILVGDFFAAAPALLGTFDALYDRAALVALPLDVRERYVRLVRELVAPGGAGLINTFEYDQSLWAGPPFSVSDSELRAHYAGLGVELLVKGPATTPRFTALEIPATERLYSIAF